MLDGVDRDESTPPGIPRDPSDEALVLANLALRTRFLAGHVGEVAGKLDAMGGAERAHVCEALAEECRELGGVSHDAARALHDVAVGQRPAGVRTPRVRAPARRSLLDRALAVFGLRRA